MRRRKISAGLRRQVAFQLEQAARFRDPAAGVLSWAT